MSLPEPSDARLEEPVRDDRLDRDLDDRLPLPLPRELLVTEPGTCTCPHHTSKTSSTSTAATTPPTIPPNASWLTPPPVCAAVTSVVTASLVVGRAGPSVTVAIWVVLGRTSTCVMVARPSRMCASKGADDVARWRCWIVRMAMIKNGSPLYGAEGAGGFDERMARWGEGAQMARQGRMKDMEAHETIKCSGPL